MKKFICLTLFLLFAWVVAPGQLHNNSNLPKKGFRLETVGSFGSSSTTPFNVAYPAGIDKGELLILFLSNNPDRFYFHYLTVWRGGGVGCR
jgi:hypothetical protein